MKIINKEYIETGLTNDNYILTLENNKKVVYRCPKDHNLIFNYENEEKVINIIKDLNIDVEEIYFNKLTGEKCTLYLENYTFFKNSSLKQLSDIALMLQNLHSLKVDFSFNMFDKLKEYKGNKKTIFDFEDNIINLLKEYQKNDVEVLCHNDLVRGNLLFKDRLYLIDYEYAANNYLEFDLASLLSENNIESLTNIKYFLECYYNKKVDDNLFKKIMTYYIFEDILWSYWALNFYEINHDVIYKKIYIKKTKRAKEFYTKYILNK